MRALFYSLLGFFLTPVGLVILAALDSSLVFVLPFGIDFAIIILTAQHPDLFWLYPILATIGSMAGAATTFWIGHKVGEAGLAKLVKPSQLERLQNRVTNSAAVGVAALAIIPPPFPFTAFVLTSGALGAKVTSFLVTLFGMRLIRFGVESALAARYGHRILTWMHSTLFEIAVGVLIALAVIGTIASAVALWKSTRRPKNSAPEARPQARPVS